MSPLTTTVTETELLRRRPWSRDSRNVYQALFAVHFLDWGQSYVRMTVKVVVWIMAMLRETA